MMIEAFNHSFSHQFLSASGVSNAGRLLRVIPVACDGWTLSSQWPVKKPHEEYVGSQLRASVLWLPSVAHIVQVKERPQWLSGPFP